MSHPLSTARGRGEALRATARVRRLRKPGSGRLWRNAFRTQMSR